MPITGLDHVVLACAEVETAIETWSGIFGRTPDIRHSNSDDGVAVAVFRTGNTSLELIAPDNPGTDQTKTGARLARRIETGGEGLASLVFSTGDILEAHRVLGRRGLSPTDITTSQIRNRIDDSDHTWSRFRLEAAQTGGLNQFVLQPDGGNASSGPDIAHGPAALDHAVILTPNPDRAAALYGARLGLRLALDRTETRWGARFMFFRTGSEQNPLTLEVVQRLGDGTLPDPDGPDTFGGLTWRVADIDAEHDRLSRAGIDVSEVRTGRKPGTRVMTVRSGTCNVPTLLLEVTAS